MEEILSRVSQHSLISLNLTKVGRKKSSRPKNPNDPLAHRECDSPGASVRTTLQTNERN